MPRRAFGSLLLLVFLSLSGHRALAEPRLLARAAVLMDRESGQVLYEKNAYLRRAPASTTKIMTALVAIEHGRPDRLIRVSRRAASTPGSSMHLRAGQVYPLGELLAGLLWASGNDAAEAIAEGVAGDASRFLDWMNRRALSLGALNTRYRNPHGLTSAGHYSSAYDLALIAREALKHPLFRSLVAQPEGSVGSGRSGRHFYNTNRLLRSYPGADGVKTGTTNAAGRCLVASATRHGWQLLAVVLKSPDRWGEARRLLEYGFQSFYVYKLSPGAPVLARVRVHGGVRPFVGLVPRDRLRWVVRRGQATRLAIRPPDLLTAPVPRGLQAGWASLFVDGRPVARIALVTAESVPAPGLWDRFKRELRHWF